MEVNKNAPVVGAAEIEIAASSQAVWDVLTDLENWPRWNPDVQSMSVQGDLATGSVFRWKAGPGTLTSTIQRVEPRDGATLVHTEESYEGLVTRLLRGSLQKTLDKELSDGLRYLKAEPERRSRA